MDEYATAIHEAGHTVMLVKFKRNLDYVTIIPTDKAFGHFHTFKYDFDKIKTKEILVSTVFEEMIIGLAGITAETIILGTVPENCISGGIKDFEQVDKLKKVIYKNDDAKSDGFITAANLKTFAMIKQSLTQRQIKAVADALMIHKTLSGEQVKKIISEVVA